MAANKDPLYIAFDVEAAGPRLGVHPLLSVGACVVTRERRTYKQMVGDNLVFYAELAPTSREYDLGAMRVGCAHLKALEPLRHKNPQFDPTSRRFRPAEVLGHLTKVGEGPGEFDLNFTTWFRGMSAGRAVIPLTDTVFFDSGFLNLALSRFGPPPLGHSGRCLKSIYQGSTGRQNARLEEVKVPKNLKPHRADYDAVELAQKATIVLYEKLGW